MEWESVIGLEIHVQLATKSKIFSSSATTFGAEPNTQANAVDLGLPGVLPVLNEEAVRMAVTFGLAIEAHVCQQSIFARKNYFYPDSPKGYQISQMDDPIVGMGQLDIQLDDGSIKTINVTRAHLEEDAGKSLHEDYQGMTGIDLNRAGTPLLEIVSEPDLRSAKEAVAYLKTVHRLIRYIGISDGNMAEGSMRCDANVSMRRKGDTKLGTRTELKNINSFRFVEKAINVEIDRQIDLLENDQRITQETRLYDSEKNETRPMRSKEEANDYRYFPDPDLLPVILTDEYLQAIKESLPELPWQKEQRFKDDYQLSDEEASLLTSSHELANYFEACVSESACAPKLSVNWITSTLLGALNKDNKAIIDCPISAAHMGQLIQRIDDKTLSGKLAKTVFEAMWLGEGSADTIIEQKGLKQVTDSGAIETLVDEVITANPEQVANFQKADDNKRKKMFGFFVGQVMKASKGKANPQQVNALLQKKLAE
ncbi:MAG: Asp-tRNA(Asn)/Glu-tRNA(Gln) amidotransferase GatCAB subunit B [Gammaproteobacteria bacterium]|nr:MAG: Asp-tRNA(Asn)/Glu-tRNA(Gln) amidotransferase GatCAB subunit B [Gammaproteobacteria bacterium]